MSGGARLALGVLALSALGGGTAAVGFYQRAQAWYLAPLPARAAAEVIEIGSGEPFAAVAARLGAAGVIEQPRLWTLIARASGKAARIRAGEYALAAGTSPATLLGQLVEGKVLLHPITLVEGWTAAEALAAIAASPFVKATLPAPAPTALMDRLGAHGQSAEGQLFPDTYLVAKGSSDFEVARLAYERMQAELASAWAERTPGLPLASPYEGLVLASIVEKESANPAERPRIAAVFVNRLRRGMKLQTDPTVIYGLGERYNGRLHKRDLQSDTPWNTYTRAGLPPTPIALPGREALRAALAPLPGDDLYFVATGASDGRHEFSATLPAHNQAVARYLARLRGTSTRRHGR